jgi:hypothetical protein
MVNNFIEKRYGDEDKLHAMRSEELTRVEAAWDAGDYNTANVTVGDHLDLLTTFLLQAIWFAELQLNVWQNSLQSPL